MSFTQMGKKYRNILRSGLLLPSYIFAFLDTKQFQSCRSPFLQLENSNNLNLLTRLLSGYFPRLLFIELLSLQEREIMSSSQTQTLVVKHTHPRHHCVQATAKRNYLELTIGIPSHLPLGEAIRDEGWVAPSPRHYDFAANSSQNSDMGVNAGLGSATSWKSALSSFAEHKSLVKSGTPIVHVHSGCLTPVTVGYDGNVDGADAFLEVTILLGLVGICLMVTEALVAKPFFF